MRRLGPVYAACLALLTGPVSAQIISPGELATVHADLAGVTNCTQCHQLRQRGVVNDRCLACHAPLRARIERGRGLHANDADQNCGSCHKDHLGSDAEVVRFDTTGFRHDETGFQLVEAHEGAGCLTCHNPTLIQDREVRRLKAMGGTLHRTFLGLGRTCGSCHFRDDPHGDQFGNDSCSDCHTQSDWAGASVFDHRDSRYPLTGLHQVADCSSCHRETGPGTDEVARYRDIPFQNCGDCHGDPHRASLGATCSTCHTTGGWTRVSRSTFVTSFDHRVTGFHLKGAHGSAECAACHEPEPPGAGLRIDLAPSAAARGFRPPKVERGCSSCHVDYHRGELAAATVGGDCVSCHREAAWLPSKYDAFAHAEGPFPLTEAHRAVRCVSCHTRASGEGSGDYGGFMERTNGAGIRDRMIFALPQNDCEACHADDDPHDRQFGDRRCATCHAPAAGYTIEAFDHSTARFTLEGAHQGVSCRACHQPEPGSEGDRVQYRPLPSRCQDCHTGADAW